MDRRRHLLKAKQLFNLSAGWHSDGGGPYLVVSDKGHRAWIHRFTVPGTMKRAEDKLGDLADLTLDEARRERDRRRDKARTAHTHAVTPPSPKLDRDKTVKIVAEEWMPSRPGGLHPEPLTDPDVSLSTYPARATD